MVVPDPWSVPGYDVNYEFSAPQFFDFRVGESNEEIRAVEMWFETAAGYESSPYTDDSMDLIDKECTKVPDVQDVSEQLHLKLLVRLDNHATERAATDTFLSTMSAAKTDEFTTSLPQPETVVKESSCPGKRSRSQGQQQPGKTGKIPTNRHVPKPMKKKMPVAKQQAPQTPEGNGYKRRKLERGVEKQMRKSTPAFTVPRAFQLSTDSRAQRRSRADYAGNISKTGTGHYISLAEQVQRFYLKTPERLRKPNKTLEELETSQGKSRAARKEIPLTFKAQPVTKKASNLRPFAGQLQNAPGRDQAQLKPRPKTTEELELEELARLPKFKALPLNRKIFESRGDLGVFRHKKRQATVPVEFKFATHQRLKHQDETDVLVERLRRLSLDSQHWPVFGRTIVQPFHLLTKERGSTKITKFAEQVSKEMLHDSLARIPKASLLPLTTEFPTTPLKPEQKACTKPEPFQLETALRHEQEQQRLAVERAKAEKKRAEHVHYRAQPIQCRGPVFVPEKSRKPLTEIKKFNFKVDTRAAQRAEYEKKMMEKQSVYTQVKRELEAARKEEEERFVRALRKERVPQAPFVAPRSFAHPNPQRKHRADAPFTVRKFRPK